ncbi:unnamed protein product, partial [Prorocentrum cordatum]
VGRLDVERCAGVGARSSQVVDDGSAQVSEGQAQRMHAALAKELTKGTPMSAAALMKAIQTKKDADESNGKKREKEQRKETGEAGDSDGSDCEQEESEEDAPTSDASEEETVGVGGVSGILSFLGLQKAAAARSARPGTSSASGAAPTGPAASRAGVAAIRQRASRTQTTPPSTEEAGGRSEGREALKAEEGGPEAGGPFLKRRPGGPPPSDFGKLGARDMQATFLRSIEDKGAALTELEKCATEFGAVMEKAFDTPDWEVTDMQSMKKKFKDLTTVSASYHTAHRKAGSVAKFLATRSGFKAECPRFDEVAKMNAALAEVCKQMTLERPRLRHFQASFEGLRSSGMSVPGECIIGELTCQIHEAVAFQRCDAIMGFFAKAVTAPDLGGQGRSSRKVQDFLQELEAAFTRREQAKQAVAQGGSKITFACLDMLEQQGDLKAKDEEAIGTLKEDVDVVSSLDVSTERMKTDSEGFLHTVSEVEKRATRCERAKKCDAGLIDTLKATCAEKCAGAAISAIAVSMELALGESLGIANVREGSRAVDVKQFLDMGAWVPDVCAEISARMTRSEGAPSALPEHACDKLAELETASWAGLGFGDTLITRFEQEVAGPIQAARVDDLGRYMGEFETLFFSVAQIVHEPIVLEGGIEGAVRRLAGLAENSSRRGQAKSSIGAAQRVLDNMPVLAKVRADDRLSESELKKLDGILEAVNNITERFDVDRVG